MSRRRRGFTLIELLVVVAVVAILVGLVATVSGKVLRSGDRATAVSQMRQIGAAIFSYASDHDGLLPGPLKSGQGIRYNPADPQQLATLLGPYLGVDGGDACEVKVFLPPAVARALGSEKDEARPFVMNISARSARGEAFQPWGSATDRAARPMRLQAVPGDAWGLCDADQKNPAVAGQPWASHTPKDIVHGAARLALYLDGRVDSIAESELKPGGGPPPASPPPSPPPPPPAR